uniref:Uncharacterized protein n=1 Tax=Ciona savignyi TaxID=51511 RepID=H2ZD47_CIOSA
VRHSTTSRQYAKQNENYTSEETASDSEQAKVNGVGRRRKVDEESDYDDTTESYTDDDTTSVKPTKQEKPLGVKKLPPRTLEPRRNVPKHYRQEGNNRQETAYTKQDPSYSRQDPSYSRQDTSYSRQDTSYSRQDTSYSRQDTSYSRQDTRQDTSYNRQDSKRENKSEHKEGPINSTTFVARGEPSRRGRGARTLGGTSSSRGRGGRGARPARGSTSAAAPSGRGGKRQDEQFKEVNREISKNGDRVSHEVDKRKSMKNERKK